MIRLKSNPYNFRRKLPHYQKFDSPIFVTFCKRTQEPLSPAARSLVLQHCLKGILKLVKGPAARSVNMLEGTHGALWQDESFDHVLRSNESFAEKLEYIGQNPARRGLATRPEEL